MSRRALLTGTVGGIIGTATAAFGIAWIFILNTFQNEINDYLIELSLYFTSVLGTWKMGRFTFSCPVYPIPYFPFWSLFGMSSFILSVLLVVTGILIGVGFYGTYEIGGGAVGVVSFFFSIVGSTLGAFFIVMGNLTNDYMYADIIIGQGVGIPLIPVSTPNFPVIGMGFVVLGFTFILFGAASIHMRYMTMKPEAFDAAGTLSLIGAVFPIIGALLVKYIIFWALLSIFCFGLILVAFILWAVVFYSSRIL